MTAAELADELEVSTRTARRDLEALATAGVPVYSRAGRGGGWSLVGGARTDLTGLTADEARALFVVAGPAATASDELKSALRKLVRALPETFRNDADQAADAVVIDASRWGPGPEDRRHDHLGVVRDAVIAGRRLRLSYADRHDRTTTRDVDPLGLVDKVGVWYVLADTAAGRRTFRLGRIRSAELLDEHFERPADFDLGSAWAESSGAFLRHWDDCTVELMIDADAVHLVDAFVGSALRRGETCADGRVAAVLTAPAPEVAAAQLAGFASRLEVLAPESVREHLARIGDELVTRYGT